MGSIIGVALEKGGVAKTSTTVNLAAAMALHTEPRPRVLIVDLDSQGHAGRALGAPRDQGPGIADVLWDAVPVLDVVRSEPRLPGVDVLAPSRRMAEYDMAAAEVPNRETVIHRALAAAREVYDVILCDLPPGLGLIQTGAHAAADWILAPVEPDVDAVAGLLDLQSSMDQARAVGGRAELLGILLTRVDLRTREHRSNIAEIRQRFGNLVLDSPIRLTTRVREASRERLSVVEYAPHASAALDYVSACREILRRLDEGGA